MNKKAQFSFLGKLILVLVTSLILLGFSAKFFGLFGIISKKSACHASAIANSIGNTATLGSDAIKLDCPVNYIKITKDSKEEEKNGEIIKRVDKPFGTAEVHFLDKINYFLEKKARDVVRTEKKKLYMYRLNEIVAKQMRNCWDELGQGKLNLFSSWFSTFGTEAPEKDKGALKNWLLENIPHKLEAPTVCVICSRIEIDPELYDEIKDLIKDPKDTDYKNNPDSLIYWLTHHPVPKTKLSYYEYLLDDLSRDVFGPDQRNYKYTEEPFAIVFARTNVAAYKTLLDKAGKTLLGTVLGAAFGGVTGGVLGFFVSGGVGNVGEAIENIAEGEGAVSALYIVPYTDEGLKQYCSVLAN